MVRFYSLCTHVKENNACRITAWTTPGHPASQTGGLLQAPLAKIALLGTSPSLMSTYGPMSLVLLFSFRTVLHVYMLLASTW